MNATPNVRIQLGSLTEEGLDQFANWLQVNVPLLERSKTIVLPPPIEILQNSRFFCALDGVYMDKVVFVDTRDFADRVIAALREGRVDIKSLRMNRGFWAAIVLQFIDQFYPVQADGARKRMDPMRYMLGGGRKSAGFHGRALAGKPFRHLAWHAVMMALDYGSDADMFLTGKPLNQYTDLIEPILGRSEVRRIGRIIKVLGYMYWDEETKSFVKGTKSAKKSANANRKGGLRDTVEVLCQFLRNYDFESMSVREIVELLPIDGVFARHIKRALKRLKKEAAAEPAVQQAAA